jgi:hypothetical protein
MQNAVNFELFFDDYEKIHNFGYSLMREWQKTRRFKENSWFLILGRVDFIARP